MKSYLASVVFAFSTTAIFAAGYEKSTLWSARYAGVGNAAASSVSGAEALFFNPAGLASASNIELDGNLGLPIIKTTGPIAPGQGALNSDQKLMTPVGVFASYAAAPHLGIGLGFYTLGGSDFNFPAVDFSSIGFPGLEPQFETNLHYNELSLGAGYEMIDGLRIGLGYRILFASQSISVGKVAGAALLALHFNGMNQTKYNGFRAGIQYSPKEAPYGLGIEWRSEIQLNAVGTSSGQFISPSQNVPTPMDIVGGPVTGLTTIPQQVSIGGHYDFAPKTWRGMAEYTFTQYNKDRGFDLQGTINVGGNVVPLTPVPQNYGNMSNYRLGVEYSGLPEWVLRAGYVLTSQVTPKVAASPIQDAPGIGNSFIVGTSKTLSQGLTASLALEYSHSAGTVAASDNPLQTTSLGDYSATAWGAQMGLDYQF